MASVWTAGRVEATVDDSISRCVDVMISGTHNRWNPVRASFGNGCIHDGGAIVVARGHMLSEAGLFVEGVLGEEIVVSIDCTRWSLL